MGAGINANKLTKNIDKPCANALSRGSTALKIGSNEKLKTKRLKSFLYKNPKNAERKFNGSVTQSIKISTREGVKLPEIQ